MTDTSHVTGTQVVSDAAARSYLEWGAVLGGATLAGAVTLVLTQFGAAVGLSVGTPALGDGNPSWNVFVAGLWVALMALASASAGGYVAGRLRSRRGDGTENEVEFRDGAHGLVVWAVSTLAVGTLSAVVAALATAGIEVSVVQPSEEAVRAAANASAIFAFASAAAAALGAAAAWYAAILGGDHRDQGTSVNEVVPVMFRRRST